MIKFWQCCFIYVLVFTVSDFNKVQKNMWIWAFCCLRCFCLSLSVQNILWSWECSCFGDTSIYECEGVMNLKWSCGNSVCEECTRLCLINRVHLFVCVCVWVGVCPTSLGQSYQVNQFLTLPSKHLNWELTVQSNSYTFSMCLDVKSEGLQKIEYHLTFKSTFLWIGEWRSMDWSIHTHFSCVRKQKVKTF